MLSEVTDTGSVVVKRAGRALLFVFNRPEIRNPISVQVIADLEYLLSLNALLDDADKLIFTGRDKVFASGANLKEIAALSAAEAAEFARRGQSLMDRISSLPIATAAAIDGFCFGGALDLALACDKRIATEHSSFCHPGAGLGIITGWGGTQRLPRLVGEGNALYMLLTAEPIPAPEAYRIGLIDGIAADPIAALLDV